MGETGTEQPEFARAHRTISRLPPLDNDKHPPAIRPSHQSHVDQLSFPAFERGLKVSPAHHEHAHKGTCLPLSLHSHTAHSSHPRPSSNRNRTASKASLSTRASPSSPRPSTRAASSYGTFRWVSSSTASRNMMVRSSSSVSLFLSRRLGPTLPSGFWTGGRDVELAQWVCGRAVAGKGTDPNKRHGTHRASTKGPPERALTVASLPSQAPSEASHSTRPSLSSVAAATTTRSKSGSACTPLPLFPLLSRLG